MTQATDCTTPYYRLSAFYLFYFASVGAFVPYWSLYLQSLDFSPAQIGELLAISMATKIFAPYVWGWIADHFGQRLRIIRLATFFAAISFAAIFYRQSFSWMAFVLVVYSFFWHAALPQFEATTISHLGRRRTRYSRIRLWGSIGFILSVVVLGPVFERHGIAWLPVVILVLLVAIWLATLWLQPSPENPADHPHTPILKVLVQWPVISLLLACLLMQASHGSYYGFFSIYLEEHGYSSGQIGWLWALGVIAEIIVFLFIHRWLESVGAVLLFRLALLITAIRWVLIALFVDNLAVLLFAQTLHAASYGLYHASAIELVNHYFPHRLQGRGQALYASVGFGLGNALGTLGSGYAWTLWGGSVTYLFAAAVCLLGLLVAMIPARQKTIGLAR